MDKIKVGIYVRVSTQEQAVEGYSINEQQERLKKYCDAHDWTVFKIYVDAGYSGGNMNRPALADLVKDVGFNKISKVIVYKLDRLSRRQRDTLYLIEDIFLTHDVDFVSMTENFDTGTPLGRAMIGILSVFAQLEREQIKERMQMGLDARAKKGLFHGGGWSPIGYDYINSRLIVNEFESMQVKKIYELYGQGWSISGIKTYLNGKGWTHKHGEWSDSSVRSVLFTPIYTGVISWKGEEYEGQHDAIIDKETFERMKTIKSKRYQVINKNNIKPFQRTTLLAGLIYCGNCGARYFCKQNSLKKNVKHRDPHVKPQRYYTCYSRGKTMKKYIADENCKNPTYNVKKLDKIILDEIAKLSFDTNYFKELTSNVITSDEIIKNVNERMNVINKQIEKLVELYSISDMSFELINEKINTLNEEKSKLEKELLNSNENEPELKKEDALNIISNIPKILASDDEDKKRDIVHSLIDTIIIYDDHISINWKFI